VVLHVPLAELPRPSGTLEPIYMVQVVDHDLCVVKLRRQQPLVAEVQFLSQILELTESNQVLWHL